MEDLLFEKKSVIFCGNPVTEISRKAKKDKRWLNANKNS